MDSQKEKKFDFNSLFIFEMANNHQGQVKHGLKIIKEIAEAVKPFEIRKAIKFQFRDLDNFIHPKHKKSKDNKHIPRFLSTRLSDEDFSLLVKEAKKRSFITICTPFDEQSVDKICKMGIEVIKIGSCSAQDWPLLEKIAEADKPVICSIGGLAIKEVDKIVSFFQHRGVNFALMHCVGIYPTQNNQLHLNQIEVLRNRYPGITIGFSTHEEPTNRTAVQLAYAKGARLFERHVGVPTEKITLNSYSSTPAQIADWVASYKIAVEACGQQQERQVSKKEKNDLCSLMRGVYAKKGIKKGTIIKRSDVFFAMPLMPGQLLSGQWRDDLMADRTYLASQPIDMAIFPKGKSKKEIIYSSIHAVKGMLNNARIALSHDFSVELSHHYGIDKFHEVGCTIIECINHREYAKKLVVLLPGQDHPIHYHKLKDETFQVLFGTVEINIEGRNKILEAGDTLWVPRGVWHGFASQSGAIFEEVSTPSFSNDSFYVDKEIAKMSRDTRKTYLHNWGRHQFDEIKKEEQ